MTNLQPAALDADELVHLGRAAAAQGKLEEALIYLKTAAQQAPNSVEVNYPLGALYAQLGMAERGAALVAPGRGSRPRAGAGRVSGGLVVHAGEQEQRSPRMLGAAV